MVGLVSSPQLPAGNPHNLQRLCLVDVVECPVDVVECLVGVVECLVDVVECLVEEGVGLGLVEEEASNHLHHRVSLHHLQKRLVEKAGLQS